MSNKVIKPVSFNITKADDSIMLDHVKRRNFSGYVKKLILADIKAKEELKQQNGPINKEMNTTADKLELMRRKLADKNINKNTDTGTNCGAN
jgi:hypothetical protein